MLEPDAVASRTFGTSFRGYDPDEVRRFLIQVGGELRALAAGAMEGIDDEKAIAMLGEEAGRLLASAKASAAAIQARSEEQAAELVREAQEEALRLRSTVDAERERAYQEGTLRAEEVLADAERLREAIVSEAQTEATRLVAEAEGARERVLRDLARRRKAMRVQVEQLHAAREELLRAMNDVSHAADQARGRLVVALPEAKVAADAAARRVEAEEEVSVGQLEGEIEAFRLAGLALAPAGEDGGEDLAVDVDDAGVEPDHEDDAPPAEAAEAPADEGRRSTSVRVFRANRGMLEPELHAVDPAAEFEEVTVLPIAADEHVAAVEVEVVGGEGAEVAEADTAEGPDTAGAVHADEAPADEAAAEADALRPKGEAVDALFARLRAGREERTAAAEAVLAESPPAGEPETATEPEPAATPSGIDRDALLARRDQLLAEPIAALGKRLKRLLADEQNTVLDAIRREGTTPDAVVAPAALAERWAAAAMTELATAAAAGAVFVERDVVDADLTDIAAELASTTAAPLAERLAEAVRRSDGDQDLAADAVRSACREWRARRLGDGVELAVHAAFGRGALVAVESTGGALCWVVDDGGSPCPDAEDNALAGPVPAGEPFPTGHRHPPAHPGCRCVLAVVALATAGRA